MYSIVVIIKYEVTPEKLFTLEFEFRVQIVTGIDVVPWIFGDFMDIKVQLECTYEMHIS